MQYSTLIWDMAVTFGGKILTLCLDTLRSYKTKKIYGQHNYNNRGTKKSTTSCPN